MCILIVVEMHRIVLECSFTSLTVGLGSIERAFCVCFSTPQTTVQVLHNHYYYLSIFILKCVMPAVLRLCKWKQRNMIGICSDFQSRAYLHSLRSHSAIVEMQRINFNFHSTTWAMCLCCNTILRWNKSTQRMESAQCTSNNYAVIRIH